MEGIIVSGIIDIGDIYHFNHHCYYAFDILFSETTCLEMTNLIANYAGKNEEDAKRYLSNLKKRLERQGIKSNGKVAILLNEKYETIAICGGDSGSTWVDVEKGFNIAKFSDFNIKSLMMQI